MQSAGKILTCYVLVSFTVAFICIGSGSYLLNRGRNDALYFKSSCTVTKCDDQYDPVDILSLRSDKYGVSSQILLEDACKKYIVGDVIECYANANGINTSRLPWAYGGGIILLTLVPCIVASWISIICIDFYRFQFGRCFKKLDEEEDCNNNVQKNSLLVNTI